MEKISLYKERSYAACISEGFKFLAQHLRMIVLIFLPYFIVISLCSILQNIFSIKTAVYIQTNNSFPVSYIISILTTLVITYIVFLFFTGRCFLMYRRFSGIETSDNEDANSKKIVAWKKTTKRVFQLAVRSLPYTLLLPIALYIVLSLILFLTLQLNKYIGHYELIIGITFITFIIVAFFVNISFIYPFYCHMMKPCDMNSVENHINPKEFDFKTSYKKGLRHFGKITGVYFLSIFILFIASLIFILPGFIISQAYISSVISSYSFDDNVMIQDGTLLLVSLFGSISYGCAMIISIATATTLLYLHGDIITKDK